MSIKIHVYLDEMDVLYIYFRVVLHTAPHNDIHDVQIDISLDYLVLGIGNPYIKLNLSQIPISRLRI